MQTGLPSHTRNSIKVNTSMVSNSINTRKRTQPLRLSLSLLTIHLNSLTMSPYAARVRLSTLSRWERISIHSRRLSNLRRNHKTSSHTISTRNIIRAPLPRM